MVSQSHLIMIYISIYLSISPSLHTLSVGGSSWFYSDSGVCSHPLNPQTVHAYDPASANAGSSSVHCQIGAWYFTALWYLMALYAMYEKGLYKIVCISPKKTLPSSLKSIKRKEASEFGFFCFLFEASGYELQKGILGVIASIQDC